MLRSTPNKKSFILLLLLMKNKNFLLLIIIYFLSLFLRLFKITDYSNLLPILLVSLIPILIYFLIKEINQKAHKTAIISAIIAAINPYLIYFSRYNEKSIIFTFGLLMFFLFFFKYFNLKLKSYLFYSLFVLIISIFYGLFFNTELKNLNFLNYSRPETEIQTIVKETNTLDNQIFHHQFLFSLRNFSSHYFNYFSPRFLIFEGDWQHTQYSNPYMGVILYPSLLFLIIGLFFALSQQKLDKLNLFFVLWLLTAPIPAALTQNSINSSVSLPFSIPLIYFISLGIYFITNKYKSQILNIFIIGTYLISFLYYADLFLNHFIK